MRLSFSSISAYQKCPLSYKFMYVDKIPIKRTPALSFGTSIHSALERFFDVSDPAPPPLRNLLKHLDDHWESEGYRDRAEEAQYLEKARGVLARFHEENVASFRVPAGIELSFQIEVGDHIVRGIIDRLDRLPEGGYEIIDYKTGAKPPPISAVHKDLQLSIYNLAAAELWDVKPKRLTLYFVQAGQKLSTIRDEEDLLRTKRTIEEVASAIARDLRRGHFPAKRNRLCGWCDFRTSCPQFESDGANRSSRRSPQPGL